jgi:hypothetical protein
MFLHLLPVSLFLFIPHNSSNYTFFIAYQFFYVSEKYAIVSANVARLALATATTLPLWTIWLVVPTVLNAITTKLLVVPSMLKISLWQSSGVGKAEHAVLYELKKLYKPAP